MDVDDNLVLQRDAVEGGANDLLVQHRHRLQQAERKPHDRSCLPAVRSHDHHRANFPGSEIRSPILEAGDEHGNRCQDERFAAASAPLVRRSVMPLDDL